MMDRIDPCIANDQIGVFQECAIGCIIAIHVPKDHVVHGAIRYFTMIVCHGQCNSWCIVGIMTHNHVTMRSMS